MLQTDFNLIKLIFLAALRKHIDKFLLHWKPEVCMGDRDLDMETKSATTHVRYMAFGLFVTDTVVLSVFQKRSSCTQGSC